MGFLKELNHDFGQNLKFPLLFFLNKMGLEGMFDDHVVKEQAQLDKKKIVTLHSCHTETFEGINPWFWTKIGNFHNMYIYFLTK